MVEEYIRCGEPIGSKTIASMMGGSLSAATVRSELAALSEMGFVEQPHKSAGRVPSHKGYRFYIDKLMSEKPMSDGQRRDIEASMDDSEADSRALLAKAAGKLSEVTGCAAISTTPTGKDIKIARLEIMPVARRTFMIMILTSTGTMRSKACRTDFEVTIEAVDYFRQMLNEAVTGTFIHNVTLPYIQTIAAFMGDKGLSLLPLLYAVYELVSELTSGAVLLEGGEKLMAHKGIGADGETLAGLISSPADILKILSPHYDTSDNGVTILLGDELPMPKFGNLSLILARYKMGEEAGGTIGIIAPDRIDYGQIVGSIRYFASLISKMLND
jgi:heat-inducible transcriptional repressor